MTEVRYNPDLSWEENCRIAAEADVSFPCPRVISDIEPYRSPIDGAYVGGRAARREDMKKHDCVPYEPTKSKPKGFSNPKFARKHNVALSEEAVHRERAQRINPLEASKNV